MPPTRGTCRNNFWLALVLAAVAFAATDTPVFAGGFNWHLPRGFPPPPVPADNPMSPAKVELGQRLFFDNRLSVTGKYSCATCHEPTLAYTDGRALAVGARCDALTRSAPSLANIAYPPALTAADPRVKSLEMQMRLPLLNTHPVEMGFKLQEALILSRLEHDAFYARLFTEAFGQEISADYDWPAH